MNVLKLTILFLLFPVVLLGQDKNIDKIEMFYDQGNYAKVYRKTLKYQKQDKYKKSAPILLFNALAEYQLKERRKFSEENAIRTFKKYIALDSTREYSVMYANYIYDLQLGLVNEIRALKETGKEDLAKAKYNEYLALFGNNISFEEVTSSAPTIQQNSENTDLTKEEGEKENRSTSTKSKKVIKEAKKHLGTPYKYGGMTPKGFDCSGFTQYVMAKNNLQLPRTASQQATVGQKIKPKKVKPGDLVFFGSSKNKINHVGIVSKVEGDKIYMIHASSSKGIMETEITTNVYWSKKMQFITRVIP